jgi:pyruvate formate lyase activating enzyme
LIRFGLIKTSLIDYPGEVAAVIFTHGCNLRCPFCHNPGLVSGPVPRDFLDQDEVLAHLLKRRGVLGAAVITGGETRKSPTWSTVSIHLV